MRSLVRNRRVVNSRGRSSRTRSTALCYSMADYHPKPTEYQCLLPFLQTEAAEHALRHFLFA